MLSLPQGAPALSSCAEYLPCSEMQLSTGSQVRINLHRRVHDLYHVYCCCLILCASPHPSTLSDKADVVRYTAVSGFVFLRFFAPAILNPKLFNLRHENPVSG